MSRAKDPNKKCKYVRVFNMCVSIVCCTCEYVVRASVSHRHVFYTCFVHVCVSCACAIRAGVRAVGRTVVLKDTY